MAEINGIRNFSSAEVDPQKNTPKASDPLGQEIFMQLMIAQFKNQDPLNPMESGDFLGQLASFGTVNGITEMSQSLDRLAGSLQSNQALQASVLVGRSVMVVGDQVDYTGTGSIDAALELDNPASALEVRVVDASGALVKTMALGHNSKGLVEFQWDGTDNTGKQVPAGSYRLEASAENPEQSVALNILVKAQVESVTLSPGGGAPLLNLDGRESVSFDQVREIS